MVLADLADAPFSAPDSERMRELGVADNVRRPFLPALRGQRRCLRNLRDRHVGREDRRRDGDEREPPPPRAGGGSKRPIYRRSAPAS